MFFFRGDTFWEGGGRIHGRAWRGAGVTAGSSGCACSGARSVLAAVKNDPVGKTEPVQTGKSGCELDVSFHLENSNPAVKSHLRNARKLMMEVLVTFNDSDTCKVYSSRRAGT